MAGQTGIETAELKKQMTAHGHRFSFLQAYRFLQYLIKRETSGHVDNHFIRDRIRVRPDLSLDFPESDIISIDSVGDDISRYRITATFLGLYGSSSPLPTFYTEDMLEELSEDSTLTRDFLDIVNAPLYFLFFKIWGKYRLLYKIEEERSAEDIERLYCLIGLENECLRKKITDSYSYLRYIGLLTQFPRSVEGLRSLLSDRFRIGVEIRQCVPRYAVLPADQRLYLGKTGNRLGMDSYLGNEIIDRMGKFAVRLASVDGEGLHRFLPDTDEYSDIRDMVGYYLDQPLIWDLELEVTTTALGNARLSEPRWSRLGWNTWLFSEKMTSETELVQFHTG